MYPIPSRQLNISYANVYTRHRGNVVKWHTNDTYVTFSSVFSWNCDFEQFLKIHDEICSFLCGQCSCGIDIDKNNYPEETELDTNPSLTLARTLTLSTGECIPGHFTFSRCYDTTIFNFAYMNSPKNLGRDPESRSEIDLKRKITIAWNWRIKNKYAVNRSWRK